MEDLEGYVSDDGDGELMFDEGIFFDISEKRAKSTIRRILDRYFRKGSVQFFFYKFL